MKRFTLALIFVFLFTTCASAFASGADLTIDELSFENSSYSKGDTATVTFTYNVPYENVKSASAKFEINGLSDMKIESARTLVCDDLTCNMNNDASFLSLSNGKLTLGAGYSGTVIFSATVENAQNVTVKCKLATDSDSISKSAKATVSDYSAPTPKPTSKPSTQPTQKPTATPTQKPGMSQSPTNSSKPTPTPAVETVNTPVTGSSSLSYIAVVALACGVVSVVLARKNKSN